MVNSLIRTHRDCNDQTDRYKVSHNVIVLRYIVQNPLAEKEICKRLLISQRYLQNSTERAIMDLCVLFFGMDGLNPERKTAPGIIGYVTPKKEKTERRAGT